ncbi:hypothetical protein FHS21_001425 [Phyllobacterium trifolii]|uniref:Uncharacterized protein n=1 Tax=Phyllobacterium trifolii TaxID=300193 RepID=A0A839U4Q3_9HYPH|nr:hypothetical protein [Phyllobacterium trifolii]
MVIFQNRSAAYFKVREHRIAEKRHLQARPGVNITLLPFSSREPRALPRSSTIRLSG